MDEEDYIMDEEDYIREPDESFSDRLVDENYDEYNNNRFLNEDYIDPYDINKAIEISMNDYAICQVNDHIIYERMKIENLEKKKEDRKNILKQFNVRLNYFKNDSNIYIKQMSLFLSNELEKFVECSIDHIYLFKKHYELLINLLDNLYTIPLTKKNKN